MTRLTGIVVVLCWCLCFAHLAHCQIPIPPGIPPEPPVIGVVGSYPVSIGQDIKPTVTVLGATPGPKGLDLDVQLTNVGFLGAEVDSQNKSTGSWIPVVNDIFVPLPTELKNSPQPVGGHLILPLLVPDKNVQYRVLVSVKVMDDVKYYATDFINSNTVLFNGYDPNPPKPPLNSIGVQFGLEKLTIAVKTDNKVTLQASWQIEGSSGPVGVQVTQNMQNPSVDLPYAAIQNSAKGFPAMDLILKDEHGANLQEAKLAFTVQVDKTTSDKVNAVKSQPVSSSQSSSTKFSWGDLAKTGVAAIMKYFTVGL
jgi:hypothetical protein